MSRARSEVGGRASWRAARTAVVGALLLPAVAAGVAVVDAAPARASSGTLVAYIALEAEGAVVELNLATGKVVSTVTGIGTPVYIAVTPNGSTAYVTDIDEGEVTPINLNTMTAGTPIHVGAGPTGIAITPDGTTAYVACQDAPDVTPIDLSTNEAETPISMPPSSYPEFVAITPNGSQAFIALYGTNFVVPMSLPSQTLGTPISVPVGPNGLAMEPNGKNVYASPISSGTVVPISVASLTAGTPITVGPLGSGTESLGITPNSSTGFAPNFDESDVVPIDLATGTAGKPVDVGTYPSSVAVTPDGSTAWVTRGFGATSSIVPFNVATLKVGKSIPMAGSPAGIVIAYAHTYPTTTKLSANHASVTAGQTVTLTATVASGTSGAPSPTGTVTFSDASRHLCTDVALSHSAPFTASCHAPLTQSGRQSLAATYSGDAHTSSSTSRPLVITVKAIATTTKLTYAPHPVKAGKPVTFTATVSSSGLPATGKVTFKITGARGVGVVCKGGDVVSLAHETAACRIPGGLSTAKSPYTISAAYGGDAEHSASRATGLRLVL
ncbi:MAG: Ig-like domain repeat protein [Acidimicrobiales bacterium]